MSKKLAVFGCGHMGHALLEGIVRKKNSLEVWGCDLDASKLDAVKSIGVNTTASSQEAAEGADIIIIAVKPNAVTALLASIRDVVKTDVTVISIASSVAVSSMHSALLGRGKIARVMPNLLCAIQEGMAAIYSSSAEARHEAEDLFSAVGKVIQVDREELLDAATGVSGSGPAFVWMFAEGLVEGGCAEGLSRGEAQLLAAQTMLGCAKMIVSGEKDPRALRAQVATPGGTTIEGLAVLEEGDLINITKRAVSAAARKARLLREATS